MQSLHERNTLFKTVIASFQSLAQNISRHFGFSYQMVISNQAALVGYVELQASNDGTNWTAIDGTKHTFIGNEVYLWNYNGAHFHYVRANFVITSGSADINLILTTKGA
jgi:hypothetical protein